MNASGDGGLPPSQCVPPASAALPAVPSRLAADRLVSPWLAWEDLESLDLLLWLGSPSRAAEALRSTSATVSRRAERCSQFLGLALQRVQSGWHLSGSSVCLERERDLQQRYRLAGFGRLRLDLACFSAGLLPDAASTDWLPSRWSVGSSADLVGHRSLELLGARVTDALLVAGEGCEGPISSSVVPCRRDSLAQLPLLLVGHRDQVSAWLRGERGQACLLPPGMAAQPLARSLYSLGLKPQWLAGMRGERRWQQLVAEGKAFRAGTLLDLLSQPDWDALPHPLGHHVELLLLSRADLTEPEGTGCLALRQLLASLRQRLASLQQRTSVSPCRSS